MKITVTFELEFDSAVSESQKMETLHKIDQAIETLEPVEMVKRTVVGYPFHVHGWSFNPCSGKEKPKQFQSFLIEKKNIDNIKHPLGIDPNILAPLKIKKL